jgi:hypothetical protein
VNYDETAVFLGFIKGLDQRIHVDELSTSSWNNVLPPDITLQQAMGYAKEHYLEQDRTIMPAHVAGRFYAEHRSRYITAAVRGENCDCINGWELVEENGHTAARKCSH